MTERSGSETLITDPDPEQCITLCVKMICRPVRTARHLPIELILVEEVVEEGDGLDCLPQAHFISQYHRVVPRKCRLSKLFAGKGQGHLARDYGI
jgi:hypothetical protein